ncbi:MAG: hypothetical protein ABIJ09_10175 [Pseudomonadota bacterium]
MSMPTSTRTLLLLGVALGIPALFEVVWLNKASASLRAAPEAASEVAIATASDVEYCSPALKAVLRRVASACGLVESGARGCKPTDAKMVAALSGGDFNALFKPLSDRARILQFDVDAVELDEGARTVVDQVWSDQRGASFFFVVSRASPDGDTEYNQQLSAQRAQAVFDHLDRTFKDPELRREVGLLWLGEEFAQLGKEFCTWQRSREGECSSNDINRSAFVAWIDCAI